MGLRPWAPPGYSPAGLVYDTAADAAQTVAPNGRTGDGMQTTHT